jgi:hypothetical protein
MKKDCTTWRDVLIDKGFDTTICDSFIGFVSWNKGEEIFQLGEKISKALEGYEGKVVAKDVKSTNYNDTGLLFFNEEISGEIATGVFNSIIEYEQEDVYNIKKK